MEIEQLYQNFLECTGANTDTRKIKIGDMFFALKGENFNGNEYAEQALDLGAKYCVVDEEKYVLDKNFLLVNNVLKSLQDLAKYHRIQLKTKIVALTGSNGKTTTKELISKVLSKKYDTIATLGNLNNHIGVPLTLLRLKAGTEIGIIEMGANHLGEIAFLCEIAEPDYGLITNFGKAHLEGFGSIEGVIKGKSELYDHLLKNNKTIIANTNDPIQMEIISKYGMEPYTDGKKLSERIKLLDNYPTLKIDYEGDVLTTQITGSYNFNNILYAIAIGEYFEVLKNDIISAIENYLPENNRSQIVKKDGNTILLDAYNANPSSMIAALDNFSEIKANNKIAILGDMFELGKDAENEHQAIADYAVSKNINLVYLVGENFLKTNCESSRVKKFKRFEELQQEILDAHFQESYFLIKGSRGMELERILELIK